MEYVWSKLDSFQWQNSWAIGIKIWRAGHNNLWYFISRLVDLNDGFWAEFDVQKFATNNFLKECDDALMLQLLEPNNKDVLKVPHLAIS